MIKKGIILLLICLPSFAMAQYDGKGTNVSRFRAGSMWFFTGMRPAQQEKVRKYDRLMFDLTYNTWNGDRSLFSNKWSSLGFNTSFMFDIPLVKENRVGLGIGLSHSFQKLSHDDAFMVDSTDNFTELKPVVEQLIHYDRVLYGHNFSIPIELRLRTKGWKHAKLHLGGKVGYQAQVYSITHWKDKDNGYALKSREFPDVNPLTYSVHARFGIRNWALYGSYNLNPIFKNTKSTQLNFVQLGLSLSLF